MKKFLLYGLILLSPAYMMAQAKTADSTILYTVTLKPVSLMAYDYRAYQDGMLEARKSHHPFVSRYEPTTKQPQQSILSQAVDGLIKYALCKSCLEHTYTPNYRNTYQHGNQEPVYKINY